MLQFGFLPYLTLLPHSVTRDKESIMSEKGPPPPAVGEKQVSPVTVVSQPSSTPSSAGMQREPQPVMEAGDGVSPGSVSSSAAVDFIGVVGEEHMQPVPPPQLNQPVASIQELLPILAADDEGSEDSVDTEVMSISASAARSRPFSPLLAPSAKNLLKLQPFVKAGESAWNPVSSSGDQSFRSSWLNTTWRSSSPQPSTSTSTSTSTSASTPHKRVITPHDWEPYIDPCDDQMYARDLSMRRSPMTFWQETPRPAQPSNSPTGSELEVLQFVSDAESGEIKDSDILLDTQNISAPWASLRPWSPQTSTKSASMMLELELLPANPEVTSTDSIQPELAQNISASLGEEPLRPWSPPPPRKRSEGMVEMPSSFDYSKHDRDLSASPIQKKLRRWPPQELTSPAERAQLEMQTLTKAEDKTSADSDRSFGAQTRSVPRSKGKKRLWYSKPSTSAAPHIPPLIDAVDTKGDASSISVVQNISALPPQLSATSEPTQVMACDETPDAGSTSAAQSISGTVGEGEAPAPPEPGAAAPPEPAAAATVEVEVPPAQMPNEQNPEDSVYAHVPHNISNIPQLRGLKAGRRHGRLRRLNTQNKMNEKYGPMMDYLGPMVAEESVKQQTQHILIASALDHFANTITQIADTYEGKVDSTGFAERFEAFKKRMEERAEKRRKRNPNATEVSLPRPPSSPPKLSEEEINRRLREETEAAVEALLTGDRSKENPNRFAEIIKSFQDAFKPPSK